ncbi:7-cyano-7-deazaguanine synthase [Pseudorhodoferax aquiterrae]|uniref:7-cyano-7-deazaguanine synthase n=1 Tax=Pseudorhodoferax aquiterrae TaxID=747304 RepID=A0ABQ3G409_9BURK|nr:7-cyano-7-deazaguanine synthase [Pseudorhodoferax aquiterrae]GHC88084.1 7-cyano-7-deazaguanine synthase [Pseudorhodoferax aquiterrae]
MRELLLLSGGVDSAALAAWRRPALALTIDYGQRAASAEIHASQQICAALTVPHEALTASVKHLGSGVMAGQRSSPHSENEEFWPFRNQYLITLAAMVAIQRGLDAVVIGTVATDGRHRDGSAEFLHAMRSILQLQEGAIALLAPAKELTSAQLVRASGIDQAVLAWSHSCHAATLACGNCPGCTKHSEVMSELGIAR